MTAETADVDQVGDTGHLRETREGRQGTGRQAAAAPVVLVYLLPWVDKYLYGLSTTTSERAALVEKLDTCA